MISEIWNKLTKTVHGRCERIRIVMVATAVCMLIANGFSWFAFYPIHDNINHVLTESLEWYVKLGRFLISRYLLIRGEGSYPLITGLLSVVFLGVSACVVTVLLRQKTRIELILTSALLSANLFMVEINTVHADCRDFFLCALMFSCLGAYFVWRQRSMKGFWLAVGFFFISFGIYPAYVTSAATLLISAFCVEMLCGKQHARELFRRLAVSLLSVATAGVLFLMAARLMCYISGIDPALEDGASSIFSVGMFDLKYYLTRWAFHYWRFFLSFGFFSHYMGWASAVSWSVLLLMAIILVILFCKKFKRGDLFVLWLVWGLLFPFVSKLCNILSVNGGFRVSFAQFLLGPILVSVIFTAFRSLRENREEYGKALRNAGIVAIVAFCVVFFLNVRYTNRAFMVQRVLYERMMFHTGQVIRDMEDMKRHHGIDDGKIALIGLFKVKGWDGPIREFKDIQGFISTTGVTSHWKFYSVAKLLGFNLNWDPSNDDEVKNLEEVKEMPSYPSDGYIKEVNGMLVIKLGDE